MKKRAHNNSVRRVEQSAYILQNIFIKTTSNNGRTANKWAPVIVVIAISLVLYLALSLSFWLSVRLLRFFFIFCLQTHQTNFRTIRWFCGGGGGGSNNATHNTAAAGRYTYRQTWACMVRCVYMCSRTTHTKKLNRFQITKQQAHLLSHRQARSRKNTGECVRGQNDGYVEWCVHEWNG